MRIALASDHAGFKLKESLKEHLVEAGHDVSDLGVSSEERCDYPPYARDAASRVARGAVDFGLLVCGSGIGMCIAANRVAGVRAAVLRDGFDAEMSRRHNDANIACLGGRVTGEKAAALLVDLFLSTPFEGGRHERRVRQIDSK
ncbi:MAG TPA: ribose 5-phosphate isomerase B [bacterium]|nr:ribose 5-phosphate isomerase B [bacterium]